MTLGKHELDVHAYHPSTIKKNVGGHGKAGKNEITRVVSMLLGINEPLAPDAADATAIALAHLMVAHLPTVQTNTRNTGQWRRRWDTTDDATIDSLDRTILSLLLALRKQSHKVSQH